MQKLQKELKNIPRNTSLVSSSISSGLNKEEIPSDQSKVLICNNSEENLRVSCSRTSPAGTCCKNSIFLKASEIGIYNKGAAIPPLPKGRGFLAEIG